MTTVPPVLPVPPGLPVPPANTITLTVDGTPPRPPGDALPHVLREHGVAVPTLCDLDGVSDVGACRLCLVEVAGRPRPPGRLRHGAEEGMVVQSDTERLRSLRRTTVELLLAERNHVCAVCVANGNCELQDLAVAHRTTTSARSTSTPALAGGPPTPPPTHTTACCAPAASASATRWRGPTPGTWPGGGGVAGHHGPGHAVGSPPPAPPAQVRRRLPHGGLVPAGHDRR